jgi:Ni/Co efflux regulator RcnB
MLKTLMTGALALSLLGGTAAMAQPMHGPVGHDRFDRDRFEHRDMRFAPRHVWVRGEHFRPVYGRSYFVVNDWYRYHLRRPPYGYHWVRYGDDYLLVALGTGIIADMLLSHNYY